MCKVFTYRGQVLLNDVTELEAREIINEHIHKVSHSLNILQREDYITDTTPLEDKTLSVEFAIEYGSDKELDDIESLVFELE